MMTSEIFRLPFGGETLRYLQYLPAAEAGEALPLVIFLHGSGERGEDLELVARHGWPRHAMAGTAYPFALVAPQLPRGHWCGRIDSLNLFLDHLLETLPVDPRRVYITGLSNGGTGVWVWGMSDPRRFAALIPVCGAGILWGSYEMVKTPLWAFHGDCDNAIDYTESTRMVERINAMGGNARLTVYPGVGHDSWEQAYSDPALVAWMLEQSL